MVRFSHMIYILAYMFSGIREDHLKFDYDLKYNNLIKNKIKNNLEVGKTAYQNPNINNKLFYHNKTIPMCHRSTNIAPKIPKKNIERKV